MRIVAFLSAVLMWPSALSADALSRFFPSTPASVPALWWALDTSVELPIAVLQQWFIDSAPGQPAASLRSLPSEGVGIGLLANVPDAQGVNAVREIMPPWPLNTVRVWPAEMRYRRVNIAQASVDMGAINLTLPLPGEAVSVMEAELLLPRLGPAAGPYSVAADVMGMPTQILTASDRGEYIVVLLSSALSAWPLSDALKITLLLNSAADSPWSLAAISELSPVSWQLHWRSLSASLSGRAQWRRALHSLLMHTSARTPAAPDLASRLQSQVQGSAVVKETSVNYRPGLLPAACGGQAGLLLAADTPQHDLSSWLRHWLDVALQGPLQPYRLLPRLHNGLLNGVDVHYAVPTLGQALWSGDHGFMLCQTPLSCGDIGTMTPTLQALASQNPHQGKHLSDHQVGAQGQLSVINEPINIPMAVALGGSLLIDSGADPSRHSGRLQYLLWLAVDGTFWLRDGETGHVLWRWQPVIWQEYRERLYAHTAAEKPRQLAEHALQLWSNGQGEYIAYALLAGQLIAIDLSDPLQPKRLSLRLNNLAVNSFSVLPAALRPMASAPELLVGASQLALELGLKKTHLVRLHGKTGDVLWRAQADGDAPQWPMPWAFMRDQQGFRAYAADSTGQTWRLQANSSGEFSQPIVIAKLSVSEPASAPEVLAAISLSKQSDANGRRRTALSLATRASAQDGLVLSVWLDDERLTPLALSSLPSWSSASAPPAHDIGWQRQFSANQHLGVSPKWLDSRILLTLETAHEPLSPCLAAQIHTRLYDLPWRKRATTELAKEVDLGVAATQVATPVITEEGKLHWLGQSKPEADVALTAYRRRLGKAPVME